MEGSGDQVSLALSHGRVCTGLVPAQEETGYSPVTNHGHSVVGALSAPGSGSKAKIGPQLLRPGQNSVCPGGAVGQSSEPGLGRLCPLWLVPPMLYEQSEGLGL